MAYQACQKFAQKSLVLTEGNCIKYHLHLHMNSRIELLVVVGPLVTIQHAGRAWTHQAWEGAKLGVSPGKVFTPNL